jgi:uncharacterized membrane protein YdjX (TVP38/TMEM64 family)
MSTRDEKETVRLIVAVSLLAAIGVSLTVLGLTGHVKDFWERLWDLFQSKEHMRAYVESWGTIAPVAFIIIQALQVVVAPIPGEFSGAAGGFIFGAWPNVIYSTAGLTLGSIGAFLAARIIGLPLVHLVVSRETLERFHFLSERRGTVLAFILYLFPGFPKDILCYVLGVSPMGFLNFLGACGLGRIPGTVMLSFSGSALYDENWALLAVVTGVCVLAVVIFFVFRQKIEVWLKKSGREGL